MRGKMLFFTLGIVAGAYLYKCSPKAQMMVEEAANMVKQKVSEKNQCNFNTQNEQQPDMSQA